MLLDSEYQQLFAKRTTLGCCFQIKKTSFFFDSFGQHPSTYGLDIEPLKQISTCGSWCILFLHQFEKINSKHKISNELYLYKTMCKIYSPSFLQEVIYSKKKIKIHNVINPKKIVFNKSKHTKIRLEKFQLLFYNYRDF